MLESNAGYYGDRMALLSEGQAWVSHRQLYNQVAATVDTLNRLGVGRGDRVAIVLPQGLELAATFLAVATCATAAPLNPAGLEKDYAFCLGDLQPRAVILPQGSQSPARSAARVLGVPVIELVPGPETNGRFTLAGIPRSLESPGGFAASEDIALVLHTSGTTSRPKLVALTHKNLLASAGHIIATLQLQPADRCLNLMSLFHLSGLCGPLLASLGAGGSTICTGAFAAEKFLDWLRLWEPTWYAAVPTMQQSILSETQCQPASPPRHSLRFIRSSSATLPPTVIAGLETVFKVPVIEAYGMTEATQITSNPLPPGTRKPGSVGPAAGPEVVILSSAGEILKRGLTGEVAIRGPNVIRGYANNPEANAAAFCEGWFKTGDQGRLDEDGYLFITGRLKELINRGGEKIAPREVEDILQAHAAVQQAVAFAVPHPLLGENVAAAVVLKDGATAGERELRQFCLNHLPPFKAPGRIVFLDIIPRGPTGKIQRHELARQLAPALAVRYEPPTSDAEKSMVNLWQEILGIPQIGIRDNFFEIGGQSLLALRLVQAIQEKFKTSVSLASLFSAPTVAMLAPMVESRVAKDIPKPGRGLRGNGAGAPMFYIPGFAGCEFLPRPVADYLAPSDRFYDGLQFPGLDDREAIPGCLEDLAASLIPQIRCVWPDGPYYLCGYSFGGLLAFEIARQLEAAGFPAPLVIMLDTRNPCQSRNQVSLRQTLHIIGNRCHAIDAGSLAKFFGVMMKNKIKKMCRTPQQSRARLYQGASKMERALRPAARRYQPGRYGGKIVLFRAEGWDEFCGYRYQPDPELGWGPVAKGGVEVVSLAATHSTMMKEPAIFDLAVQIQACLERAKKRGHAQNQIPACAPQRPANSLILNAIWHDSRID